MQRYIESSASTISTLTKKLEILDAKVANSETNYIVALKKINELENENKELRKVCSAALEKIGFLEGHINQDKKSRDDNEQNLNRRLMTLEGEQKETERRLDRTTRSDAESKITGNAELQMMAARINSLAEEMRMSVENGKRWADQERERSARETTDTIREHRIHIEKEQNDLKNFVTLHNEKMANVVSGSEAQLRRLEDKVKQIVERVKENEAREREKHQKHANGLGIMKQNIDSGLENVRETVEELYKILDGKVSLSERQLRATIADLKKLVVLADTN